METFGGFVLLLCLGICVFSILMRLGGKGKEVDGAAIGALGWFLKKLK